MSIVVWRIKYVAIFHDLLHSNRILYTLVPLNLGISSLH